MDPATRRSRLAELCLSLPEANERGGQHSRFDVRGRTFAYYLNDHHGDGIVALACKAGPGDNDLLVRLHPERFRMPEYLWHRGWVALRLDLPTIDWAEVSELVRNSYRLIAPKSLARRV